MTDDPIDAVRNPMPDPEVWPRCSDCHTTWVMRRAVSWTRGSMWVWQPDCKHKRAQPELVNADGPYPQ